MQQVQWLQGQLNQRPLLDTCQVRITLSQTHGTVSCNNEADAPVLRAAFSAFLLPGQAGEIPSEACLTLRERQIEWTPCDDAPSKSTAQ